MYEPNPLAVLYWSRQGKPVRPFIGGPLSGMMDSGGVFVSVEHTEYLEADWFGDDGELISAIWQHESIRTLDEFHRDVTRWATDRSALD